MTQKTELIPDFKRVIVIQEVRRVLRQNDKNPREERYMVECKVYFEPDDKGGYKYYYLRDNSKVYVRWSDDANLFVPVGDGN